MNVPVETVESEAMALSRAERSRLVVSLLQSVESRPTTGSHETAWVAEANRRYEDYLHGKETAVPADVAFAELRADDK